MIAWVMISMTLVFGSCPDYRPDAVAGCAEQSSKIVYITPSVPKKVKPAVLGHEVGHMFDYWYLDDSERAQIEADQVNRWTHWEPEAFADEFSACYISGAHRRDSVPYGVSIGLKFPEICRMITADRT